MPIAILGLDINDYNTSAALAVDGRIVAAAQEERFNREKRTRRFPAQAMAYCLRQGGLTLGELTAVAISSNPAIYLENLSPVQSERARFRGELLYAPVNYLLGATPGADALGASLHIDETRLGGLDIHYLTHHDCHAATALLLSPFDSGAILSLDGFGEKETTVFYRGDGAALYRKQSVEFPHSVGCFYSAMTSFLGLQPDRHEWKLMAAAAHGDPQRYLGQLRSLLHYRGDGRFEIDLPYFNYYQFHRPGLFTPKLVELLGPPYTPEMEPDARFFDLAAATQQATEELVFALLRDLAAMVSDRRLCLTGGVAMNCVLNGKITAETPFEEVFVPPMPDDSGTSLGAALLAGTLHHGLPRREPLRHNYLGPSFTDEEIRLELERDELPFSQPADVAAAAAARLAAGQLVGWFQGGLEFGDRALGNRSILADPRDATAPARINARIKDRRPYQPFAPSILAERAADWFDNAVPSPFMEKTFRVRPAQAARIPAVLGPDGHARLQTVTPEQNGLFHRLIAAFDKATGVPLVLNTSFNLRGEPIVCSGRDAIRTFYASGLDALFIGPYCVEKRPR